MLIYGTRDWILTIRGSYFEHQSEQVSRVYLAFNDGTLLSGAYSGIKNTGWKFDALQKGNSFVHIGVDAGNQEAWGEIVTMGDDIKWFMLSNELVTKHADTL
jgi:hypothetical protein